jgi:hypothetical protein
VGLFVADTLSTPRASSHVAAMSSTLAQQHATFTVLFMDDASLNCRFGPVYAREYLEHALEMHLQRLLTNLQSELGEGAELGHTLKTEEEEARWAASVIFTPSTAARART